MMHMGTEVDQVFDYLVVDYIESLDGPINRTVEVSKLEDNYSLRSDVVSRKQFLVFDFGGKNQFIHLVVGRA
jgi:hypothetical protein